MAASLVIDRSNLGRDNLTVADDPDSGYTLGPDLAIGSITWKKNFADDGPAAMGRVMTDFARAPSEVHGTVVCYGEDELDLQSQLRRIIRALTQVKGGRFRRYWMAYHHGPAVYKWRCTEPADVLPGGVEEHLDDEAMANFIQPVAFTVIRHPFAVEGPI